MEGLKRGSEICGRSETYDVMPERLFLIQNAHILLTPEKLGGTTYLCNFVGHVAVGQRV